MNFGIDENFGQLLSQIAYEYLTKYDIDKAKNVYKDALIGIDDELVKELLIGNKVVEFSSNNASDVSVVDYDSKKHSNYFTYKPEKELFWRFEDALNFECLQCLADYLLTTCTYKIKVKKQIEGYFNHASYVKITADNILDNLKKYNWLDTLSKNKEGEEKYRQLKNISDGETNDQMLLAQVLYAIDEVRNNIEDLVGLCNIAEYFNYDIDGETKNMVLDYLTRVNSYFDFKPYSKIFEKHIYPCYQKYEAGFIAPNGDIYGMNGAERNMLHLSIADKIAKDIDLSEYLKEYENGKDFALERAGWIKFHGCTFNRYQNGNHLTDAQAVTIAKYADDFLSGIIGFEHDTINTNKWKQMDNLMREKYFNIF